MVSALFRFFIYERLCKSPEGLNPAARLGTWQGPKQLPFTFFSHEFRPLAYAHPCPHYPHVFDFPALHIYQFLIMIF